MCYCREGYLATILWDCIWLQRGSGRVDLDAIAYDYGKRCIYWVDQLNDVIQVHYSDFILLNLTLLKVSSNEEEIKYR